MADTAMITFGGELRRWRDARRYSQLALAAEADVSQRHLSFLETGRSHPSREMVLHLGRALELGLRDQNLLLAAAGYAAEYTERGLDDPDLDEVRDVLIRMIEAHGHIPAYVVDRGWDIVMTNTAALNLVALAGADIPLRVAVNAMRTCFHPKGIRSLVSNWEQLAAVLIHRLERELIERPFDERLGDLLAEARGYPGVADLPTRQPLPSGDDLLIPMQIETPSGTMRLISMIATIGSPFDITLEELRIETLLPADAATEEILRATHQT